MFDPTTGEVTYKGVEYTPSGAAMQAFRDEGVVRKSANGWDFWRFKDVDGNMHQLRELKSQEDDHGVE